MLGGTTVPNLHATALDDEQVYPCLLYTSLFAALEERGLLRPGIDLPQLIMSFKTMQLGLTALWAVEGPPFEQTAQVVQQQMQFFTEGILRKAQ